jgi:hypothetical protein
VPAAGDRITADTGITAEADTAEADTAEADTAEAGFAATLAWRRRFPGFRTGIDGRQRRQ